MLRRITCWCGTAGAKRALQQVFFARQVGDGGWCLARGWPGAVPAAAQHRFKADAASPPQSAGKHARTGLRWEGTASQSPRSLSLPLGDALET
jgi:hypothetical protein